MKKKEQIMVIMPIENLKQGLTCDGLIVNDMGVGTPINLRRVNAKLHRNKNNWDIAWLVITNYKFKGGEKVEINIDYYEDVELKFNGASLQACLYGVKRTISFFWGYENPMFKLLVDIPKGMELYSMLLTMKRK